MDRESLRLLLSQGESVEKIALRYGKHPSTVSCWMEKHGLRAVNREKHAAKGGIEREHLEELVTHASSSATEGERLVAEAGGRCILCGYDRRPRALEFHHVDPASKRFALSRKGVTLSLQTLRAEASKCVLLRSNCHAEVEDGSVTLPDTVREEGA